MNFAASLLQLLPRQIGAYTQFLDLLRQEQAALAHAQPEVLENCLATRAGLVTTLEAQDLELRTLFANANIAFSTRGVKALFATFLAPQSSQLEKLWQRLLTLAAECKKQNEINSKIIDTRRQHTDRVLRILTGQTTLAGTTYAADGRVQSGTASAALATA
jgi:flagellar biosynthesis/type III secretory pathway chaperone